MAFQNVALFFLVGSSLHLFIKFSICFKNYQNYYLEVLLSVVFRLVVFSYSCQ
jgi:hypothetical protein